MNFTKFRYFLLALMLVFGALLLGCSSDSKPKDKDKSKDYHRIVIASDVHYITKSTELKVQVEKKAQKQQAMARLNGWKDVKLVVFTGDIIAKRGTAEEYALAKEIYNSCSQPKTIVAGNHEIFYSDALSPKGSMVKATPELRKQRQEQFKKTFNQPALYYTKELGNYLLVFVAPDKLNPKHPVELSDVQLSWLEQVLSKNSQKPTIIFCHAPLEGTLTDSAKKVYIEKHFAQPAAKLGEVLLRHPHVKLWVSGHTHTKLKNENFADTKDNLYKGKIMNIHNPSWEDKDICVNSLYLYKDKVVITTYNLTAQKEIEKYKRVIRL